MEKLEQILLYQPRQVLETTKKPLYKTSDLEWLSVVVLYTGDIKISPIKVGMKLPGGLEIKKIGKNTIILQEDFGGVGNIYSLHPDGHGSLKFYGLEEGKKKETKIRSW